MCCGEMPAQQGDEFDKFLRLTGGEAASRGGHLYAVAAHEKKVALPAEVDNRRYYYGRAGILAAVAPDPMDANPVPVLPMKVKRSKR